MPNVAVIYGLQSKSIRRVVVSDTPAELAASTANLDPGEGALPIAFSDYTKANHDDLMAAVANAIGPASPTRCVEVDKTGTVVAVLAADPVIDKPVMSADNTLELHPTATVGDVKSGGAFPVKPTPTPLTSDQLTVLQKYHSGDPSKQAWTQQEADTLSAFNIIVTVAASK